MVLALLLVVALLVERFSRVRVIRAARCRSSADGDRLDLYAGPSLFAVAAGSLSASRRLLSQPEQLLPAAISSPV